MKHIPHKDEIDENPYSLWRFVKFPKRAPMANYVQIQGGVNARFYEL